MPPKYFFQIFSIFLRFLPKKSRIIVEIQGFLQIFFLVIPSEKFPNFLLGFFPNNCVISLGTCLKNNSSSRCFISVYPRHCFGAFSRDSLREPARYSLDESFGDFCRVSCGKSLKNFFRGFPSSFSRDFSGVSREILVGMKSPIFPTQRK